VLVHAFVVQALVSVLRISAIYEAVVVDLDMFWIGVIGGAFGILSAALGLRPAR